MKHKGYYEPEYNDVPVWFKAGCYALAGVTVGLIAALLWCNLVDAAEGPSATAAKAQSAGLSGSQTIQAEAVDTLPTDEPDFYAIAESNELPTDEPVSAAYIFAPTGAEIYEADYKAAEPARSYNGITEGNTISATLTYYDVCAQCCGSTQGVTASGQVIYNGMENPHAVALNWLPLGSIISIDGTEYTVADRGGATLDTVGRVDVFTPEGHSAALALGTCETTITVVRIGCGAE